MSDHYTLFQMSIFGALVVAALAVDLWSHRRSESSVSLKNAASWSAFWVILSLGFAAYIACTHGNAQASLFLAGYLLEKSLSVDNLFVFMAVFASFRVQGSDQHRVLYYGILGALILRFVFILAGVSILAAFETPVLIAFALLILWSAWKMFRAIGQPAQAGEDYSNHGITRLAGKILPVSSSMDGHRFFTKKDGSLKATPMFLCLLTVEFADLMFAFDSVPAVIAVTRDPFLIYSSNILAVLGLRSMYFILAAAKKYLVHLEKAVVAILVFIGVKIILETLRCWPFGSAFNLYVIFGLLLIGIAASFATKKSQKEV